MLKQNPSSIMKFLSDAVFGKLEINKELGCRVDFAINCNYPTPTEDLALVIGEPEYVQLSCISDRFIVYVPVINDKKSDLVCSLIENTNPMLSKMNRIIVTQESEDIRLDTIFINDPQFLPKIYHDKRTDTKHIGFSFASMTIEPIFKEKRG